MTVRRVLVYPDPVLKRRATPCGGVDDDVRALAQDLCDTLDAHPGVGIAAPQLGASRRVAVVDMGRCSRPPDGTNHGRLVLIDPAVLARSGTRRGREGCLSLPDVLADIARSKRVRVRFLDRAGELRELECEGFEATAVQHELDHLDGILFPDRVTSLARGLLRRGAVKASGKGALAEPHEALVHLLAGHLGSGGELVRRALALATRVHEPQVRDEGTPYIEHPIRVARTLVAHGVADAEVIAAALLHDVLEDGGKNGVPVAQDELARDLSPRVAELVSALTKSKADGEEKAERDAAYFRRIEIAPVEAQRIKVADRLDNVRGMLASPKPDKRRRYAYETYAHHLPLARRIGFLADELAGALRELVDAEKLPPADFAGL